MLHWFLNKFSKRYRTLLRERNMFVKMVYKEMSDSVNHRINLVRTIETLLDKHEKFPERNLEKLESAIRHLVTLHKDKANRDVSRKKAFAKRYVKEERS